MEGPPNGTSATQERLNKKPRLDSNPAFPSDTTILEQDSEPGLYDGDDISDSKTAFSVPTSPAYSFARQPSFPMSPSQPFAGIPGLSLISGEKTEEEVKQDVARSMEFEMTSPSDSVSRSPSLKRTHPQDASEDVRMTSPMPPSTDKMDEDREKTPVPAAKTEDTAARKSAEEGAESKDEEAGEEEFRFDSSDGSDSDDESSSDDSDDDSDEEMTTMDPTELAKKLMEEAEEDEDATGAPPKTKNEVEEEYIELPDVKITESTKLEELGTVSSVVGTLILIKAKTSGEYQVLNEGSVLATADRSVFGAVNDTIGRVEEPLYTVRFNSSEQVASFGLVPGKTVYYLPQHSTFVFTKPLIGQKGSDASNLYDEEIPEEEQEFSDDEKEAARKAEKKKAKQKNKNAGRDNKFNYEATIPPPSYDDEPYVPLQRPPHLPNKPANPPPRTSPPTAENNSFQSNRRDDGRSGNRGGRGGRGGRGARGGWNNGSYNEQRRESYGDLSNRRSPVQQRSPVSESHQSVPAFGQYSLPQQSPVFTQTFLPQALYATGSQSQSPPVTPFSPPSLPPGAHINPAFFRQLSAPSSPVAQTYPQQFNFQQQQNQPYAADHHHWPVPPPPPFPPSMPTSTQAPSQTAFPTPWLQNTISPPPLQQPVPVAPAIPQAAPSSPSNTTPTGSNDEAFKKIQDKLAILSQLGGI